MRLALAAAAEAGRCGEAPVGAVILDETMRLLAVGTNRKERDHDPSAHAEIVAIREACPTRGDGWRLTGCTLVVSLEPCVMCAGAIVAARIDTLVFGAFDEKAGAVASVWDLVRDPRAIHRPQVVSGIMAEESATLLREFFAGHRDLGE